MKKPFSRTFRVRWSEIDANGQVDLAGYFRYVIETAWDWGAANGLSSDDSHELGLAWVIRETELKVLRPLLPNEIFDFTIWLYKWRRVRGTRFFELRIKDKDEIVAQGAQQVVTLDIKTMRPTPPPLHIMDNFLVEKPQIFQQGKIPKINLQKEVGFVTQRTVEWRDLDMLDHVNNAVYAEYAENAIALALESVGWSPEYLKSQQQKICYHRVHMKYLAPAKWGDQLDVYLNLVELKSTGGVWYLGIQRAKEREPIIESIIEWSLADRVKEDIRNLPESLYQRLEKFVVFLE